jgi:hypothetical protein
MHDHGRQIVLLQADCTAAELCFVLLQQSACMKAETASNQPRDLLHLHIACWGQLHWLRLCGSTDLALGICTLHDLHMCRLGWLGWTFSNLE